MWEVLLADEFEPEFFALQQQVQDVALAIYRELIRKADDRFDAHLGRITKVRK